MSFSIGSYDKSPQMQRINPRRKTKCHQFRNPFREKRNFIKETIVFFIKDNLYNFNNILSPLIHNLKKGNPYLMKKIQHFNRREKCCEVALTTLFLYRSQRGLCEQEKNEKSFFLCAFACPVGKYDRIGVFSWRIILTSTFFNINKLICLQFIRMDRYAIKI